MEPVKSEGRAIPGYSLKQDGTKVSDEQIKEWLMEGMEGEAYAYGYRKLTVFLRRTYGLCINKKKVYRLCKEMDILRPQRQKRDSYSKKLARNRIITGSNQLFETDIKYGYIEKTASFSSSPFWTYMTVRSLRIIWVCPVRQRMRVVRYNRHYLNGNYLE
ncbi:IS3 family transposase [Aneurinibacillus sp. XH2]|uniref:IS3 family transposase n=1 Tax=Aneurinibacillus sp. XH2 TaxID=1450761 RepID=UPI0009E8FD3F|nr:IS3 family transposase [Aneurinibacillus sp. XH2]